MWAAAERWPCTALGEDALEGNPAPTPTPPAQGRGTWKVGRDALSPQPLLQVWVDFRDILDRHQAFGDILSNAAWLSQPRWQERLDLPQREKERDEVNTPKPARPAEQGPRSQALKTLKLKRLQERGKLSSFSWTAHVSLSVKPLEGVKNTYRKAPLPEPNHPGAHLCT